MSAFVRLAFTVFVSSALVSCGWSAEPAAAQAEKSSSGDYSVRIQTDHYVVWARKSAEVAENVGKAAEELREDFLATFSSGMKLKKGRDLLPIVCSETLVSTRDLKGRRRRLPGVYNSWTGVAFVTIQTTGRLQVNQNRSRVRHEAAHQLMDDMFEIQAVKNDRSFWYREGLACYFEGSGKHRLNGTVRICRLGAIEAAFAKKALPSIQEVIGLEGDDGRDHMGPLRQYALAWSLCHFLVHGKNGAYRDRFFAYLSNLQEWNKRGRSADVFSRVFGDLEVMHEDWVKHVYLLQRGTEEQILASLKPVGNKRHRPRTDKEKTLLPTMPAEQKRSVLNRAVSREKLNEVWTAIKDVPEHFSEGNWKKIGEKFAGDEFAPAALAKIAASGNDKQRLMAVRAIGELNVREAMEALIDKALKDPSRDVRLASAQAVGKINYGIAPGIFYSELRNAKPAKALPAIEALGEIGDSYAIDFLLAGLRRLSKGPALNMSSSSASRSRPRARRDKFGKTTFSFGAGRRTSSGIGLSRGSRNQAVADGIVSALKKIAPEDAGDTVEDWLVWGEKRKKSLDR